MTDTSPPPGTPQTADKAVAAGLSTSILAVLLWLFAEDLGIEKPEAGRLVEALHYLLAAGLGAVPGLLAYFRPNRRKTSGGTTVTCHPAALLAVAAVLLAACTAPPRPSISPAPAAPLAVQDDGIVAVVGTVDRACQVAVIGYNIALVARDSHNASQARRLALARATLISSCPGAAGLVVAPVSG